MTELETIAARILEEDRIGPFDISSASTDGDVGEPVHITIALRPERNPALIRNMMRGLFDAKESHQLPGIGCFKLPANLLHPPFLSRKDSPISFLGLSPCLA